MKANTVCVDIHTDACLDEGHYSMGQKSDNEIGDMLMPSKVFIYE